MKPTPATTKVRIDARTKIRGAAPRPLIGAVCHVQVGAADYRGRHVGQAVGRAESSVVVRPEPIDSETYSVSSRLQAAGLRRAIALFEQAADTVPLPRPPQPIVIADYGASTGHNSLLPISAAIPVLRNRTRPEHSVLVVHTDVPDNNFTVLFEMLADDPDTLSPHGCCYLRFRRRPVVLQPDHPVQQRAPGLVLVGDPMAEPGPGARSRSRARVLQRRRSGANGIRQAGRTRLARVRRIPRPELCPGGQLVVMTMALDEQGEFGLRPLLKSRVDTLRRTDGRWPADRRRSAPHVPAHRRAPGVGLFRPVRAVGPFRTALHRPSRGVRCRGPVLDAVPSRPRRNRFRRAVGRIRQGVGVSDIGDRAVGRSQRSSVTGVLRPAGGRN